MSAVATRAVAGKVVLVSLTLCAPIVVHGQTDYVNTDLGRPLAIHDALAMERHALEWHFAPATITRRRGQPNAVATEAELAWGAWRRTQVELGVPVTFSRGARGAHTATLAGVDARMLHQLNTETLGLPALAVGGEMDIPTRGVGRARFTVMAAATRTVNLGRLHVNARYTPGPVSVSVDNSASRWLTGLAWDRIFPLHFLLVSADVYAARPFTGNDVTWFAGAGVRWQASPSVALDAGTEHGLSGARDWRLTLGVARAFGVRRLIGGAR